MPVDEHRPHRPRSGSAGCWAEHVEQGTSRAERSDIGMNFPTRSPTVSVRSNTIGAPHERQGFGFVSAER